MKVSMSKAAKLAGIQRSTLYRHIEEKGISVIKEEGQHPKIDVSELIRVYGDQIKIDAAEPKNKTKNENRSIVSDDTKNDTLSDKVRIAELEAQLRGYEKIEKKLEDEIEYLRDQLQEEKTERKQVQAVLTDQRKKSEDQIKSNSNKEELLTQTVRKLQHNNKVIMRKLQEQDNKTLWKKIFG